MSYHSVGNKSLIILMMMDWMIKASHTLDRYPDGAQMASLKTSWYQSSSPLLETKPFHAASHLYDALIPRPRLKLLTQVSHTNSS